MEESSDNHFDNTFIQEFWENNNIFQKQDNNCNPEYKFFDGPPFMTGTPHYGHILAGMIKDTITRHKVSQQHNVKRISGSDCHGLPIEYEIEKELGIKTTEQVLNYGIGNYNNECKKIVLRCKDAWKDMMGKLGRWIDFDNGYTTMSKEFMNSVWWVFSELYKKNRIYEGVRIMPYSTTCGTPLSNFEKGQNYKEVNDDSLYVKFKIINDEDSYLWCNDYENCYFVVWTTTPWTLPSNYLLAINKNMTYTTIPYCNKETNKKELLIVVQEKVMEIRELLKLGNGLISIHGLRGEELIGLKYEPFFTFNNLHNNYRVVHADYVSNTSGTGIVHTAPSHGEEDYKTCLENGFITKESKLFMTLDVNGFVNNNIPDLKGMFYKNYVKDKKDKEGLKEDLNTWVIRRLKENNQFLLKKTIKHEYPFCWRSDTPLIYKAVSSHFVKVEDMSEKLVELNKEINWVPKHVGEKRFSSWLENTRDWGISRNRFWGTPIPIWRSEDGDEICVSSSYELEELLNLPENSINDLHRDKIDHLVIIKDGKEYKRLETVLDCWFESGSMPYASLNTVGIVEMLRKSLNGIEYDELGNPFIIINNKMNNEINNESKQELNEFEIPEKEDNSEYYRILPADFIAEGLDQTRGWFYTLLVLSTSLFNKIPFKNVIVNGIVLNEKGEKMSKRLKNYPDPEVILNKYSSDCMRLYLLSSPAVMGESLKFSESGVSQMMKDVIIRIKNGGINFLKEYTKLFYEKNNEKPLSDLFSIKSNRVNEINEVNEINKTEYYYESFKVPLNLWFIRKYGEYRNEFFKHMDNYNLRQAIPILFLLIEDINNGYIKMGRYLLKGNDTKENCMESLSTLYFVFMSIAHDFKSIVPFLSESLYQILKEIEYLYSSVKRKAVLKSVHLAYYDEDYPRLDENKLKLADDFNTIYEIIKGIHKIRSKNNKNAKKPIKNIYLLCPNPEIIVEKYFDYIYEECNILDIKKVNEDFLNITKSLVPVKSLFFRKYGKEIKNTFDELLTKTNEEIELILENKVYNDFEINEDMFNTNYNINFNELNEINEMNDIKLEEVKINDKKIFVIANIKHDEEIDKLYYAKLFATKTQRMRKNAGLHPWNKIKIYWEGKRKYDFNEAMTDIINKTVKMEVKEFNEEYADNVFYQEYCDKTELKILFEKAD